ncbi:hypothetical protein ACVWW1_005921 [Bradyrhizobium sp. JR3.5]
MPVDSSISRLPGIKLSVISVPRRLAADQDGVALADLLQLGGERAVLHLDREELELFLVIGARHRIGAQQRPAIDLEADHGKLAILEAETGIAGGSEAEKRVGPVLNRKNFLSIERAHGFSFSRLIRFRMI